MGVSRITVCIATWAICFLLYILEILCFIFMSDILCLCLVVLTLNQSPPRDINETLTSQHYSSALHTRVTIYVRALNATKWTTHYIVKVGFGIFQDQNKCMHSIYQSL